MTDTTNVMSPTWIGGVPCVAGIAERRYPWLAGHGPPLMQQALFG
jgi:hypothetical protein